MKPRIAILGEYSPTFETHIATKSAIEHSRLQLKSEIEGHWMLKMKVSDFWHTPGNLPRLKTRHIAIKRGIAFLAYN